MIYFLTHAENRHSAESRVNAYLETENFFDYSCTLKEESGPLETKRNAIDALLNGWNWKAAADALLETAKGYKAKDNLGMYGYNLIRAGELYSQSLTIDTYVFNIDYGDYSIPPPNESEDWWAVAVDFHY
jgi:hypothetical protein